ncbi:hypothetical protein FB554_0654 [Barrientosiimonas humi]|uniref:Integral membrane protein n=2 Tax=Barrientosiimonas TaxID=1535207 RepID=A0A542X9L9_9MICO|nr:MULTISPECIES: hypothetical protein [Barrientosiimonas]TQL32528.1 hypothetical protein FB554_0654 [Barrientosiimonas humi]BDZ57295.1 hypothetical protein GCM10025872_09520 [Barrientosiimonas endolithica]CAG7572520.1 hypothetical protein BH39T_PBIAJDOK_01136 [Barrientosiimonas humi]
MVPVLTGALVASLLLLAGLAALATARGRAVDNPTFYAAALVELLLVVQVVVGIALRDDAPHGLSTGLFVAYLLGMAVVPPAAFYWALADRESRWGTGVLAVAALGLMVMVGRLLQIWNGQ